MAEKPAPRDDKGTLTPSIPLSQREMGQQQRRTDSGRMPEPRDDVWEGPSGRQRQQHPHPFKSPLPEGEREWGQQQPRTDSGRMPEPRDKMGMADKPMG